MKKVFLFLFFLSFISACNFMKKEKPDNYNDNKFITREVEFPSYKGRLAEKSQKIIDGVTKSTFVVSYDEFNGAETIWHIENKGKSKVTLYFTSRINKGKVKGVFINDKNLVANVFSEDIKDGLELGLGDGIYRIKLVGDKFSGKVNLTLIGEGDMKVYLTEK